MEIAMLDNKTINGRSAVRNYGRSASPLIQGMNTAYDIELEKQPMDEYAIEGAMALEDPESSLIESNWVIDSWRNFSKNRDEINLMSERARLVKEINPVLEDIDFELQHIDNRTKLQELEKTLQNTNENDPNYQDLVNQYNNLRNAVSVSQPKYEETLAKYGERDGDYTVEEKLYNLNSRKDELLSERESVNAEIKDLYDSLRSRGGISNEYKIKEQTAQDKPLFSGDYAKYAIPGIAGSSFATLGQYATALGSAGILWAGSKIAAAVAANAAAAGSGGTLAPMAIAATASAAAAITNVLGNLYSRRRESLAQVYGAYKDKVNESLQTEYGIDLNSYVAAGREQLKNTMPAEDVDRLTDDEITDRILSGEINVDSAELKKVADSSRNGLQSVYDRNMALSAMDIAETALVSTPLGNAMAKLITKPIGKLAKPLSKLAAPVAKKYSKVVDDYIAWNAKLAMESPKKAIALKTAKDLTKLGFSAVGEAFEEGAQDVFDADYIKGEFDDKPSTFFNSILGMVDGNYRTAKILAGIDTTSELANDPMFWNDVKGGLALGLFLGGAPATYNSVVGSAKQLAANNFVRDMVIDNMTKKDKMAKIQMYANKGIKKHYNYNEDILGVIESYKRNLPEGVEEADVDKEIELAKSVFNTVQNKEVQAIAKEAGFNPGSDEFNTYVGLLYNAKDELEKASSNKQDAFTKLLEATNDLQKDNVFSGMDEATKNVALQLTDVNSKRSALQELINVLESPAEEGKKKFGIANLDNPIAKKLLKESKTLLQTLDSEANRIAEANPNSKLSSEYMAPTDSAVKVAATFLNNLLANADYNFTQDYFNIMHGQFNNEKGGLTRFSKLDKNKKKEVGKAIKKEVENYGKDAEKSNQLAKENANKMVKESTPAVNEVVPKDIPEPFSPEASSNRFDDSFEEPEATSTPETKTKPEPKAPVSDEITEEDLAELDKAAELERLSAEFEEAKRKALENVPKEEEKKVEKPTESPRVLEDDIEGEFMPDEDNTPEDILAAQAAADEANLFSGEDAKEDAKKALEDEDNPDDGISAQEQMLLDDAMIELESRYNNIDGVNPSDSDAALHTKGLDHNKVSNTLFYNPLSTRPMLPGYKTGKELSEFLSTPGVLTKCKFRFFIDKSFTDKSYSKPYKSGDKSTYDAATIMVEIVDGTDKYLAALKTPETAALLDSPQAVASLKENRDAIIVALEAANESQEVVPVGMHLSNGNFNQNTRNVDGLNRPVFRSVKEVKGMNIPENPFDINPNTVDIAIGKGIKDGSILFGSDGQKREGHGGSGQIFFITKPSQSLSGKQLPIQLNLKRFNPLMSNFLAKIAIDYSDITTVVDDTEVETNELFNFIVRFGENTQVKSNDDRISWLRNKQFFKTKQGFLVVGDKIYNPSSITEQERNEIVEAIQGMHWRVNKNTFWKPLAEALPSALEHFATTNDEEIMVIPGIKFTREQFLGNEKYPDGMTVMGWMIENGLIECDLKDELFKEPFLYFDEVSTIENDTLSPKSVESSAVKAENTNILDSTVAKPEQPKSEEVPTSKAVEETTEDEYQKEVKKILESEDDPFSVDNMFGGGFARPVVDIKKPLERVSQKEIQWFKNKLGLNAENLEIVEQAIALGNNQYAMGLCRLYSTVLWKGAERGTLYHEAFHKVSLLLLSPKERNQLYTYYRNRNKFDGTDTEIEELLAEEFRKYMIDNNDQQLNIAKRLFKLIKNFINKWVNRSDYNITKLFEKINNGYYSDKAKNKASVKEWLNRFTENGGAPFRIDGHNFKNISNVQFEETVNTLTAFAFIKNNIRVKGDLSNLNINAVKASIDPAVTNKLLQAGRITKEQADVRNEIFDTFDTVFKKRILKNLGKYQISVKEREEQIRNEIEEKAVGNDVGDAVSKFIKQSNEISARDNALTAVKIFVASLPNTKFVDGDPNRMVPVINPATGMPTTVDYYSAWNSLANELASSNTFDEILETSARLGKLYPLFQVFGNELLKLTTPIENESEASKIARENLKTQIRNTFRKNKSNLIFIATKSVTDTADGNTYTDIIIRNENANKQIGNTLTGWVNELIQNSKLISVSGDKYVTTDETNENNDKIVKHFDILSKTEVSNKNLAHLKQKMLLILDTVGMKVDMQSFNSYLSKYYPNSSPITSWNDFVKDTTEAGVRFLLTKKIPDLKTIDGSGNIKTKYTTSISDFYKRNVFANRIAEAYNINHPSMDEVSVLTTDGKLFYTITEHNYLTDFAQEISNNPEVAQNMAKVMYNTGNNAAPNKFIKGSVLLNNLLKGRKISIETVVGFRESGTDDPGRKYTEISPLEDYVMKMALTASNKIILPTMGDSQRYDVISGTAVGKNFKQMVDIADGKLRLDSKILKRFLNYFETELDTIEFNYNNPPVNEKDKVANYDKGARNGYKFRYFNGFFKTKEQSIGGFAPTSDFTDFNEALSLAEDIDIASGDTNYTTAKSIVKQIRDHYESLSASEKANLMNQYLLDAFVDELNYAQEIGLIQWDGRKLASVTNVALPSKMFADAKAKYEGKPYSDALTSIELLSNYFANTVSSVIEFEKIFIKDPAYYKSPVDKIKRYREVLSTGVSPRTDYDENPEMNDLKEFTVGTLEDNEIISRQIDDIRSSAKRSSLFLLLQNNGFTEQEAIKAIEDNNIPSDVEDMANAMVDAKFKGYKKVNQTDATVLLSPEGYKQLVRRIDGWTPDVAKAFDIMMNADILTDKNSELYQESLGTLIKPLKVMYFGDHFNEELKRDVPIFDKMAMFPVFPVLATGDMKHILEVMQNPDKPIHMLAFESAVKVGQDSKTKVYNKDNTVNVDGLAKIVTHKQPLKNFRRQLITDPHTAHEQMFVTQAQKAAILNVRHNNTYTTPDGKSVSGKELLNNVFGSINALTKYGKQTISNKFGVSEVDGTNRADKTKVAEVLYQSADASNMNQNVMGGLEVVDGKPAAPLSGLSDNAWMESSLISLMNREIIDINTPGGMFIQMSSIMYNDLTVRKDEGIRGLKFDNADGSVECVISINLLKDIIPDYENKSFSESKDWLIKAGIIGNDSKAMAMGYRIPAQGPSSTAALKVVDVYPENVGDTITLPDEWTGLTGSDFDIDKLFVARYNYDSKGNKIKFITKDDYINELKQMGFDDETVSRLAYNKFSNGEFEANSKEANQNNLIDMYIASISNPLQYAEAKQPLDTVTDYLTKKMLTDIDNLHGEGKKVVKQQLHYATPSFQSSVKAELNGGKFGIGPFALANSHHSLAQAVNLSLNASNKTLAKYNISSLHGITSTSPNYHDKVFKIYTNISDWISALINAHVDVAKDPYIIRLNVRQLTFNMTNFLVRAGKGESTFYFLSQDILRDFAIEHAKYSGKYGVDLNKYETPESRARKIITSKYEKLAIAAGASEEEVFKAKATELSREEARKMFDIPYLRKIMPKQDNKKWYLTQLRVLKAYDELTPGSKALSELTTISQIDTKKFGNNFALQQNFLMKMAKFFVEDRMFNNAPSIIRNTFLYEKLKDGLFYPREIFGESMIRLTNQFETIRNLFYAMSNNRIYSDSYVNAITRGMEATYKTAFIVKYAKANNIRISDMLYGSNSIANRLIKLKRDIKNGIYPELLGSDGTFNNALLDNIDKAPKVTSTDFALPDFLVYKPNKSAGNILDDQIIRAWEELLELNNEDVNKAANYKEVRDFARDLAIFSFYTSGDAFGKNNIFKFVPNSFREKIGYFDDIRALEENPSNLSNYIKLDNVIPGLWWNDDVVSPVNLYRNGYDEFGNPTKIMKPSIMNGKNFIFKEGDEFPTEIPDYFIDTEAFPMYENKNGQSVYPIYVKVNFGLRNDPSTTMLYKLVALRPSSEVNREAPIYKLVNKKGMNYRGKMLAEFIGSEKTKSAIKQNNVIDTPMDLTVLGYTPISDFVPYGVDNEVLDPIGVIKTVMEGKPSTHTITEQVTETAVSDSMKQGDNINNTNLKTYSGKITKLEPNQIFVFGSNTQGRHGKGAALTAAKNFGAVYGQAEGIQGQSYAIITKDLTKNTHPSRTPEQIKEQIHKLYEYAKANPDKEFLVAYSGVGANLNAYSNQEMADMFSSEEIPNNIVFEEQFNNLISRINNTKSTDIQSTEKDTISNNPSEFTNHSGGAEGSDSVWLEIGNEFGVTNQKHYYYKQKTPKGNVDITDEQYNEGVQKVLEANKTLNRKPSKYLPLLARNWMQVKMSDAVFAIGKLKGSIVDGGTGWAVQMAIDNQKPVYVFDQITNQWYEATTTDGKTEFIVTDTPVLTKNFAGIGTREITEEGKQAIRDVYEKTFSNGNIQTTDKDTINIYAGTGENADLSNFANRPFKQTRYNYIGGNAFGDISEIDKTITFNSVENAFQANKVFYSSNSYNEDGITDEAKELFYKIVNATPVVARKLGRTVKLSEENRMDWDRDSQNLMQGLIQESFEQNPEALQKLLATGNATLTHTQDKGKWGTEFPRILMEVREALRNYAPSEPQEPVQTEKSQELQDFDEFVNDNSTWIDTDKVEEIRKEIQESPSQSENPYIFTFASGFSITTPFILNDQQKYALLQMEAFMNNESENKFTLMGYAGTGKTTIMSLFDKYLRSRYYSPTYVAPTHRANAVTKQNNPNVTTATLHSLLGLKPDYDLTATEFSVDALDFAKQDDQLFQNEVFIIDESSMIGDSLYQYLIDSLGKNNNKIIFLGDPAQLKPVNNKGLSKVFTADGAKVELTKVERTGDNPILKEATRLRQGLDVSYETELNSKGEGVIFTSDKQEIMKYIADIINSENYKKNKGYFKVLSADNSTIGSYNRFIRTVLFGKEAKQLEKGDLLMAYANEQYQYNNKKEPYLIINSVDYVVESIEAKEKTLPYSNIKVNGFRVGIRNSFDPNKSTSTFILDVNTPQDVIDSIINRIDEFWTSIRAAKLDGNRKLMAALFREKSDFENSFSTMTPLVSKSGRTKKGKTFDYGYAHTIHKSQGGTYNKVVVLGNTIESFGDPEVIQQLKYVAVSRAKEQVLYTKPTAETLAKKSQRTSTTDIDLASIQLSDTVIASSANKEAAELDRLGGQRIEMCKNK